MVLRTLQAITKALDTDAQQAGSAVTSSAQSLQEGPGQLLEGLNRGLNQTLHEVLPGVQESFDATASEVSSQVGTLTVYCYVTQCTWMLSVEAQFPHTFSCQAQAATCTRHSRCCCSLALLHLRQHGLM